jgi:hypothetical protein
MKKLIICATLLMTTFAYANKRMVEMAWGPTPGAIAYEFKLYKIIKGSEKVFSTDKLNSTLWSKDLTPGEYAFQIRSLDYRNVAGAWGKKKYFKVSLPTVKQLSPVVNQGFDLIEDDEINISFIWEEIPEADRYNFKLMAPDGSIIKNENTTDTAIGLDFEKPGKYFWKVTALSSKDGTPSNTEFKKFFVIHPPKMPAPEVQFDVNDKFFSVKWDSSNLSKKDKITIYLKKNGKWTPIFKDEKKRIRKVNLIKNKIPKGQYKLKLLSFTDNGRPSEPSTVYFKWDQNDISNVESRTNSLHHSMRVSGADQFGKTPWKLSFGLSSVSADFQNIISKNDTSTTTGYIGNNYNYSIGREFSNGKYYWDISGNISNVVNENDTWLLVNAESTFEYHFGNKIHDFHAGVGGAYKSLPFALADVTESQSDTETRSLDFIAAKADTGYYYALSDHVSIGIDFRLYLNLLSTSNPMNAELEPSVSTETEIGVKYLLTRNLNAQFYLASFNESLTFEGDSQTYSGNELGINLNIDF